MNVLRFLVAACITCMGVACTYTRTTRGLECTLLHYWKGRELYVEVIMSNNRRSPVTLVGNPNFCWLSGEPVSRSVMSSPADPYPDVSFKSASRSSLVTVRPGSSVAFLSNSWSIRAVSAGRWRVRNVTEFDTTVPLLRADFRVWWNPRRLPWYARIGRLNIFAGKFEQSKVIRLN